MDIKTYKKVLPILMKNRVVPFVWGNQGIGKTQVHRQIADALGVEIIYLNLATQEVGDLVGLLMKDEKTGMVYHAKPEWFPTEGKGIIMLDEFNRAHPDVLQAMFPFVQTGRMHTHKLGEGWSIAVAGNYQNENFNVTDTSDAALASRFCHIHLRPTVEEFVLFAKSKGAMGVAEFIQVMPELLETKTKASTEVNVRPDRRAWLDSVARLDNETLDEGVRIELYSGIIGDVAALQYVRHSKISKERLRLETILADYPSVQSAVRSLAMGGDSEEKTTDKAKKTRFDLLAQPIRELLENLETNSGFLNPEKVNNLKQFLKDLPKEVLMQFFKKTSTLKFDHRDELMNNPDFIDQTFGAFKEPAKKEKEAV